MTDEEMAEAYAKRNARQYIHNDGVGFFCTSEEEVKQAFLAGLKAGKDINVPIKWHKVADGDLPKDEDYKWCISRGGYCYVAKYEELFVSWRNQENKDVLCPYAWKEIVLPTMENI